MDKALEALGLDEKEARVYLAALELGETSIARIADRSRVRRTTVYDVVASLEQKGLLGKTLKRKKRYYFAADPRDLEEKLEERKIALKVALPRLLSIANLIDKKPRIRFYEGIGGLKQAAGDLLTYPGRPVWSWLSGDIFSVLGNDYLEYFVDQRIKKKISGYVIVPDSPKLRNYITDTHKSLRRTRVDKLLVFDSEVEIGIYLYGKDRIAILAFKEEVALIIESAGIFTALRGIFDAHWSRLSD